jgi:hypothetical protein
MTQLPEHVRKIVDEIETEIGEPGLAELAIEGAAGRGGPDNGRVEAAVQKIIDQFRKDNP